MSGWFGIRRSVVGKSLVACLDIDGGECQSQVCILYDTHEGSVLPKMYSRMQNVDY